MIGLDTNVLVRYLVKDDARQARRAARAIAEASDRGEALFLCQVVLCELVWVLESAYGYERATVADALERVLRTRQFEVEARSRIWGALARYRDDGADFADHVIGLTNRDHGCDRTLTFDRELEEDTAFELL